MLLSKCVTCFLSAWWLCKRTTNNTGCNLRHAFNVAQYFRRRCRRWLRTVRLTESGLRGSSLLSAVLISMFLHVWLPPFCCNSRTQYIRGEELHIVVWTLLAHAERERESKKTNERLLKQRQTRQGQGGQSPAGEEEKVRQTALVSETFKFWETRPLCAPHIERRLT